MEALSSLGACSTSPSCESAPMCERACAFFRDNGFTCWDVAGGEGYEVNQKLEVVDDVCF